MTDLAVAPRPALRMLAGRYRQLRTAHPVEVLRWLRNGMLLGVAAAALLYVWVAIQAGHDIDAARQTSQGIMYTGRAVDATRAAGAALRHTTRTEDVTLTGIGQAYAFQITQVNKYLALVAEDNAAGTAGTAKIQFVQGQLETYLLQSETAIRDYDLGLRLGEMGTSNASIAEDGLASALEDLRNTERAALAAQRRAWPLDPATFWWVLLGPVIGLLLLAGATARVLARHFRRHVSPWLQCSLLITAATVITAGFLNWSDERELAADPWAGHPVTLAAALLLFLVAAVLAYLGYRPRLAEYRFRPS